MKKPAWQSTFSISLQKNLCSLAVTIAAFFLCSETASLKGKQLVLQDQTNKQVSLNNHDIPELCRFTVCVDLNKTETGGDSWTAYSYDTSGTREIELALTAEKGALKVYILGNVVTLHYSFRLHRMHQVCCVWDGNKHLLEVFHDGGKTKNLTLLATTHKCLRPNGTLLMGQLHQNNNGHVVPFPAWNFVGILHYFQMWDHVRDQQEMIQCQPGNVVSWQGNYWSFSETTTASALHQRCGEMEPMPGPPPPTVDVPEHWTNPGSQGTTTSKSQGTPTSLTAHPNVVTTVPSSSITTTTPKSAVTPSDNGLSGMPSGTVPSHNPQQTISTSMTDGTTPIRKPTSIVATTMPYSNTPTSGFSGTTSKFEMPISTSNPGETTQLYATASAWTWSDATSQYGGSTPKQLTPTSKLTHTRSTSRHHGSVQQSDTTAPSTQQLVTTKPISRSKATTTSFSVQTTPLPSQSLPVQVSFYNIQMNFSVSSKSPESFDYYDAVVLSRNWLIKICKNSEFVVTNHNIKANKAIFSQGSLQMRAKVEEKPDSTSYFSKSVVKATSDQTTKVLEEKLQNMLRDYQEEGEPSMKMDSQDAAVTYFDPGTCLGKVVPTKYKGTYRWPDTRPANTVNLSCERNPEDSASRTCLINVETRKAYWRRQNLTACQLLEDLPTDIVGLKNVTIMEENAQDVANHILTLLDSAEAGEKLSNEEIQVLIDKLTGIAGCEEISQTLATKTLKIINIIITKAGNIQDLQQRVNSIFTIIEQIGFKVDFVEQMFSIVQPSLALALLRPDPMSFHGIIFGVTSYDPKMDPEIDIRQVPFEALASVSLPGLLRNYLKVQSFQPENHTEIQFSFFGTPSLFEEHKNSSYKNAKLNSYVVGASIENTPIQDLKEPVNITLKHIQPNVNNSRVYCVFWDFTKNGGLGGWNKSGCNKTYTDANHTVCNCNHLTHFGVLLDLSREPINEVDSRVLTMISYAGCGISCIFLGLALVVYLSIDKLCGDYPSQILVNLCFALLMLNLVYLMNSWLASFHSHGLCIAVASALHYFLLAAFTWMGLEAIHMYYALVKVFSTYIPNYMIKLCIIGWGIPAIIVAIILIVGKDFYGTEFPSKRNSPSMLFCWIQNDVIFYASVVAYFCMVFLTNIAMLITVILQIQEMKARHRGGQVESWHHSFLHDLKRVASLSCLLGLTWGFAFFAWGPVDICFTYLFAICNTLQGFFIFVFHCLMKENVRKQCQMNFCCGRFRLSYSDGSVSATTLGYPSRNLKRKPSSHSLRSLKSCATTFTSNSSGGLPGVGTNVSLSDHVSWHASCAPSSCQSIKLPRVRSRSSMDAELCQTHKTGLLY